MVSLKIVFSIKRQKMQCDDDGSRLLSDHDEKRCFAVCAIDVDACAELFIVNYFLFL
jgi:hypothetical protein